MDTDFNISTASVFDWGNGKQKKERTESEKVEPNSSDRPSRYDPAGMSRIVDITDLVDDSDVDSEDEEIPSNIAVTMISNPIKSNRFAKRLTIVGLFVVIMVGGVGVGLAVMSGGAPEGSGGGESERTLSDEEQLNVAERVVIACDEEQLNDSMSRCQSLCHNKMCCFEQDGYNCADDASKYCAAHAACDALVSIAPGGSVMQVDFSEP